jgi:deazaflavin-dependent oxidoreductase (nitroreductase family)
MARTYRLGPLRRAINAVMTAALRRGFGPKSTYLLTTTGRKSGQPRTTPVTLVEAAPQRWLVSSYGDVGWVHNVRANPEVKLTRGSKTDTLRAAEVDAQTAGPVLRDYVRQVPVTAPYFDAKRKDPVDRFIAEADRHPVFRLVQSDPQP